MEGWNSRRCSLKRRWLAAIVTLLFAAAT